MRTIASGLLLTALLLGAHEARATSPARSSAAVPRLIDLGAGKCIPCKAMAPILEQLKKDYAGKLDVRFIDVWKDRQQAETYAINMIPTQIFYDASGRELGRHEGFIGREEILTRFEQLGVKLPASSH